MQVANPVVFRKGEDHVLDYIRKTEVPKDGVYIPPEEEKKQAPPAPSSNNDDEEEVAKDNDEDGWNIPIYPTNSEIPDMRLFVTNPVPKDYIIQCTIKRDKSGLGRFFPKYHMYFSDGLKFIMTGKKRPNNRTSNYGISLDKNGADKGSPSFLGKLR